MNQPLGQQAQGLEAIYQQKLSLVPKHELAERMQRVPVERFEWPLILAFMLLMVEFAMSDRKPSRRKAPLIQTADRRIMTMSRGLQAAGIILLAGAVILAAQIVHASPRQAEQAYQRGNYDEAMEVYKEAAKKAPDNTELQFNVGAAAYKEKKYKDALGAFQAALTTQDLPLQNKAYYNLGNSLYRVGEGTQKLNPQNTIQKWEASIKAYDGALKLNPDDADAQYNRDYVKKKLEELKKQQKQDKKNSCNNKNNQNQNKDQNKGQNKDQNNSKNPQADNQKNNQNKDHQQAKNQNKDQGQKGDNSSRSGQEPDQQKNKDQQKNRQQQKAGSQPDKDRQGKDDRNKAQASAGGDKDSKKDPSNKGGAAGKQEQMKSQGKRPASPVQQAGRQRRPGQMTDEQAKNLLDSLKGEEASVPMMAGNKLQGKAQQEKNRRDW